MAQIDNFLAQGWTYESIRNYLKDRRPAPPKAAQLARHVDHLAAPHRMARRQLEHDASQRGQDLGGDLPLPQLSDLTKAALQRLYEAMASGAVQPSMRDIIAAMKYQSALEAEGNAHADVQACQDALIEIYEIARRHLGPEKWQEFARDVYASEAITTVIGRPVPTLVPAIGDGS
jgi:hypothetical protein